MAKQNRWTREQTIISLNLYCQIPFNKVSSNHPVIVKIANIIGRTPNSVKMKIGNFGSFDPELLKRGIVGLGNTSKLDEEVWNEFNNDWDNLAYESELLISKFANKPIERTSEIDTEDIPLGKEREAMIKQRINQKFFRSTILSSYNLKCCVTGLSISDFLVASHIVPWSKDEKNRLNPRNGLCLNSIHDKAFDKGFITITTNFKVKVSKIFENFKKDNAIPDLFLKYDNQPISLPDKFHPSKEFLDYHYNNIFQR
ncbi:MAG: HNH endonuclease [Bacteroidales bacterium]|nr:HNH endonuclease [Bacteroidales bacterium]